MYGDCQVMSNMGGGSGISSDSIFPSFNFMPFTEFSSIIPKEEMDNMVRSGKEEMESGSGSDQIEGGLSGNELDIDQQQPPTKKKRYHRHTAHQIQEMEALFKECPHPDDKRRMRLSQELGLKPRQVKFWFQNRRTQMKAQQDRSDNAILRNDNENLRNENSRLENALRSLVCSNCGGSSIDEQQLRMENARLKEELDRVCLMASQFCGGNPMQTQGQDHLPPMMTPNNLDLDMNMYPRPYDQDGMPNCNEIMQISPLMAPEGPNFAAANGLIIMDDEKPLAVQYALSFMDEVVKMCRIGEPLWTQVNDAGKEVLNFDEHAKMFPCMISRKIDPNELRYEASRASSVVIINSITLVDAFLDADKWMELFPSIISRAKTLQVITSGVNGTANASLQLMYAELQMLSPLVPTREIHFLRYCARNSDDGSWAIVDFPLDSFHETYQPSLSQYKRHPSGCIIQDMPNGYSRVTWVEHAEVENGLQVHGIFNYYVSSGLAFGAQRWLAVLQRQCERLASLMARNISDIGAIKTPEARMNLMNVAQRMLRMFCLHITGSCGQSWTALSESVEETVRITTRKATEPGQPNGLILTAVSTTWLPHHHYQVFDLLRDERSRSQLDILSNGNPLQEVAHIANGSHPGNCISLLRVNVASNSSQNVELVLQESCTDDSGSLVVYSTVEVDAIKLTMNGGDPSCIPLLPLGFVIIPMGHNPNGSITSTASTESGGGCLLTVGLQVLANSMPNAKLNLLSANTVNNHIQATMQQIITALGGHTSTGGAGSTVSVDDSNNVNGFDEPSTIRPSKKVDSSPGSKVN
ncbi:hypothetical protein R6Q57_012568 [Mikania cordata]